MLQTAKLGLADLQGAMPERRMPGLRNIVVFGVATTQAVQNLRSAVGKDVFNAWYEPIQQEMKNDPLLKYFWRLRSQILKEGTAGAISNRAHVSTTEGLHERIERSRPRNGETPFILDQFGGSGWIVMLPDGREERYYVDLPEDNHATMTFFFADAPNVHLGVTLTDTSIAALAGYYIEYLDRLISAAHERFK